MNLKLTSLGADNGNGDFERGGDLDVTSIAVSDPEDYNAVADAALRACHLSRNAVRKNVGTTRVRHGLWLISFTEIETGQAVVLTAEWQ